MLEKDGFRKTPKEVAKEIVSALIHREMENRIYDLFAEGDLPLDTVPTEKEQQKIAKQYDKLLDRIYKQLNLHKE